MKGSPYKEKSRWTMKRLIFTNRQINAKQKCEISYFCFNSFCVGKY